MKIRSLFYSIALILSFLIFSSAHAREEQDPLPSFFNIQESLPIPDIGTIKQLRFVTSTDFAPFNFINHSGYLAGYHIDLIRAICVELKLEEKCKIEALPFNDLIPYLKRGGADAAVAGIAATAQTHETLNFTAAYLHFPARFMALAEQNFTEPLTESLKDQPVGVIENTAHEKLLKAYFPMLQAALFANQEELFAALQEGKVKIIFGDGMQFSFWLNNRKDQCCHFVGGPYMAPQFLGEGLRIAVPRERAGLIQLFNSALKSLERKGRLKELYLRYFPIGFY